MSQDLEQYQTVIEQLKPMVHEPEFNQVLNQVAASVPKQKRFLLKMELKRLAKPCTRLIDLRGHVDGECRLYEYEGRNHYLDDIAVEVFERQIRTFGEYTIGVYEAVSNTENNFRVMHKQQQQQGFVVEPEEQQTSPHVVDLIQFGKYSRRTEERMNYAVNVEIFTEANKSIQASTVDISVNGLKVKLTKEQLFKAGERITIQFRGLEGEYTLDKKNGIAYRVTAVDRSEHEQRLCLQRVHDTPTPAFNVFIERFIHGNKRRYKVNMDNTLDAIRNKTFEQYYVPTFTSMPIFIEQIDEQYQAKFVLSNDSNSQSIYYWGDEKNNLKLGYIFKPSRIKSLLSKPEGEQETFIYAFNHINNDKLYFYSATQEELFEHPELMPVYLGYGARKASWRIYKLQLTDMAMDDAHLPLSIPDSINDTVKRQNQPPPPRLMARLKHMTHVALLTDITDELSTQHYQKLKIDKQLLSQLKLFGHPRNKSSANVSVFRFKYINQRKETRFQLRSRVVVKIDQHELEGVTEDVSVGGMRIELNTAFHNDVDSLVKLSFPALQKVTRKYELVDLPYEVRSLSKDRNVIRLQVGNSKDKVAQRFFEELIRNNKSKLKASADEEKIPGIGEALRNIYAKNNINLAFFIRKEGIYFLPEAVATSTQHSRLLSLLKHDTDNNKVNLSLLYKRTNGEQHFMQHLLKKAKTNYGPMMRELYVAFEPSQSDYAKAIDSRFSEEFKDDTQRQVFITQAMSNGQFIAIKVFIARTGRPDIESLQSEINYVATYALHRSKEVEEQLWSIVGVGDMLDITDHVMQRYAFTQQQIIANRKQPELHKAKAQGVESLLKA